MISLAFCFLSNFSTPLFIPPSQHLQNIKFLIQLSTNHSVFWRMEKSQIYNTAFRSCAIHLQNFLPISRNSAHHTKNYWGGCPTPSLCKNNISSAFYYNIRPRQADNERPIAEKTAYMPKDFEMGQYIGNFFIILHPDTFI